MDSVVLAKEQTRHRAQVTARGEGVHEPHHGPLRLPQDRHVEAHAQGLLGPHGDMRTAGHQHAVQLPQPRHQLVGVPHPAGEQRHPHHVGPKGLDLSEDAVVIEVEVPGSRVDDPDLVARAEQRGEHVLLPQQGRTQPLGRGRVEQQHPRGTVAGGGAHSPVIFTGPSMVLPFTTGPTGT